MKGFIANSPNNGVQVLINFENVTFIQIENDKDVWIKAAGGGENSSHRFTVAEGEAARLMSDFRRYIAAP